MKNNKRDKATILKFYRLNKIFIIQPFKDSLLIRTFLKLLHTKKVLT